MTKPRAPRSQKNSMGQTSSQLQQTPPEDVVMEHPVKSKDKRRKSKTGRRSAEEEEGPVDREEESARALMQLAKSGVCDGGAPYYNDDLAASQQLLGEGFSPLRSPASHQINAIFSQIDRKKQEKNPKKKRGRESYTFTRSEERNCEEEQYPHLPSTPPRQVNHPSPSPYRPRISQKILALDDISTDDEAVTSYMEEYGKEDRKRANASQSTHALDNISTDDEAVASYMQEYQLEHESAGKPESQEHDICGFSEQPPNAFDQDEAETVMTSTYHLPKRVYTSPNAQNKSKKRRRRIASTSDDYENQEQRFANGRGQYNLNLDLGDFDGLFNDSEDLANFSGLNQADDLPIDPELHGMSALPPPVDLNRLDNHVTDFTQKKRSKSKESGSASQSKRRRVERSPDALNDFYSPYAFGHDQGNMQDRVLPGFEDIQRRTPPEVGSPFMENIGNSSLESMHDRSSQGKGVQRKKTASASNTGDTENEKGRQPIQDSKPPTRSVTKREGPYTAAEAEQLDNFRDAYCNENAMSHAKFNDHVQTIMRGNSEVKAIFDGFHEVLPYRPRISVQKFCRRRYHNFHARGTWTAEEDEMLKQAVAEKGNNWKVVGQMVDRMGEDCRNRYRDYIFNAEKRNREQWTDEEVTNLCVAILECMQAMKDERRQTSINEYGENVSISNTDSEQEAEDMKSVNWQVVSDKLEGTRSRLQCRFKWTQLKAWEQKQLLQGITNQDGYQGRRFKTTKNPWRMKQAVQKVANMRPGDLYALLQSILSSGVASEGNIPWRSLGDDSFRARWNGIHKKAAWTTLKRRVPDSESMSYRSIADILLQRLVSEDGDKLNEKWDPEVHCDVSAGKRRRRREAKRETREGQEAGSRRDEGKKATKAPVKKERYKTEPKSNEHVHESDEEEVAESDYEPQDYNRYNTLPKTDGVDMEFVASSPDASTTNDQEEEPLENANAEEAGDRDSLFEGSDDEDKDEGRIMADGDLSPRLARQVQSLQHAQV